MKGKSKGTYCTPQDSLYFREMGPRTKTTPRKSQLVGKQPQQNLTNKMLWKTLKTARGPKTGGIKKPGDTALVQLPSGRFAGTKSRLKATLQQVSQGDCPGLQN